MTRKVMVGFVVCAAVASGLATRTIVGQGQPQASASEYQERVLPVLSKSCMGCHNEKSKAGSLSLEAFNDPAAALADHAIWPKVLDRVAAGTMPPASAPALSSADRDAVTGWIRMIPGIADAAVSRAGPV